MKLGYFTTFATLAISLFLVVACGNTGEEKQTAEEEAGSEATTESASSVDKETTQESTSGSDADQASLVSGLEDVVAQDEASDPSPDSVRSQMRAPSSGSAASKRQWQGVVEGQVFNQAFRLPLTITLRNPVEGEQNPINVTMETQNPSAQAAPSTVGYFGLASALQFATSSGGATATGGATPLALQYFTIEVQGSQINGTLTDAHFREAAAANLFQGPNVTGQTAPPGPVQRLWETVGDQVGGETFAFLEGTQLSMNITGNQLTGSIEGQGQSVAAAVATSGNTNVVYQAQFSATEVT